MRTDAWTSRVEDYLRYRRQLGFELTNEANTLHRFAEFAERHGLQDRLSTALAVEWARASKRQTPITWARRLEVLRGFAFYWKRFDPSTEIPDRNALGPAHRRLVPHIYTAEELTALLNATDDLLPCGGLRPATCRTVLGLLAASGLRIGEAIGLTRRDVDLDTGVLTIREAKFHKSRLVPLHPTATAAMRSYAQRRDTIVSNPNNDRFFILDNGKPANQRGILFALHSICAKLGWKPRGDYQHHRLHDLRHTHIVASLLRAYQHGDEIDRIMLALSTYIGHAKIADTYWYVTGIPELMAIAAARFQDYAQGEPK